MGCRTLVVNPFCVFPGSTLWDRRKVNGSLGGGRDFTVWRENCVKELDGIGFAFFFQVLSEKYFLSTGDHVLNYSLVAVVGKGSPVDVGVSVALEKCRAAGQCITSGWRFLNKDEVALFGGQHDFIPVDYVCVTVRGAEQIGGVQVRVTDDVGEMAFLQYASQRL